MYILGLRWGAEDNSQSLLTSHEGAENLVRLHATSPVQNFLAFKDSAFSCYSLQR